MAETYEQAEIDYVEGMKYKDIAEKYGVSLNTVKSWKQRYGWSRKKGAHKEKSVHTKSKRVQSNKKKQKGLEKPFDEGDELTDKQRLFCMYYVKYFNATKAYQKAYGCDYFSAKAHGYKLLRKVAVKEEIDRMKEELAAGIQLDAQFVLQKYIDIAFADITDYVSFGQREQQVIGMYGPVFEGKGKNKKPVMETVNFVDLNKSTEIDGTIVSEVKQGRDGISVKLADKMKALDKLSLYFDLFPDKFKRQIEEEKVRIAKQKLNGDDDVEYEDDGFLEALQGKVSEVWDDAEEN
jgi:phage terminase small subunit